MKLIIRWLITALALLAAARFVPGISITDQNGWYAVLVMAAVFGLVNAFVRPVLEALSCAFIALTLGLFLWVINAVALLLASWAANTFFGAGFVVDGFVPALLGSIVVSIVSGLLSLFVHDNKDERRSKRR